MIVYKINSKVNSRDVLKLIEQFPQYSWRTPWQTENAIKSSICNVVAVDEENNKLVGIVLAGSPDNAYFVYVHSLMVHPEYQGRGIGLKIMKLLLKECRCKREGYMDIVCFAAPGARELLERAGFRKDFGGIQGMILDVKELNG